MTLCYRRERVWPHWPYNLYCMLHGRDRDAVLAHLARRSARYGLAAAADALRSRRLRVAVRPPASYPRRLRTDGIASLDRCAWPAKQDSSIIAQPLLYFDRLYDARTALAGDREAPNIRQLELHVAM